MFHLNFASTHVQGWRFFTSSTSASGGKYADVPLPGFGVRSGAGADSKKALPKSVTRVVSGRLLLESFLLAAPSSSP